MSIFTRGVYVQLVIACAQVVLHKMWTRRRYIVCGSADLNGSANVARDNESI